MSDDPFEAWKRDRARADVPPDFAAGVLARLPVRPARVWLRVAACVLAGLACVVRIAAVLGFFLPA